MKIVCEACAAKYSIADDKVRGKVFKIRCKKCSHIIVVRGTGDGQRNEPAAAQAPAAAEHMAAAADAGAQWYVVVDGEQVGPLGEADVSGRISRGEVSPETYAWREGMADWAQLASISEFAQVSRGAAPHAAASAPAANFDDRDNPFAPQPTAVMPAGQAEDMFKQASAPGGNGAGDDFFGGAATAVSAPPGGAGLGDLFASQPAAQAGRGEDMFAVPPAGASKISLGGGKARGQHAPSPASDAFFPASASDGFGGGPAAAPGGGNSNLMGQRSENSVLFSLSNLEALATPSAGRSASPMMSSHSHSAGPGAPSMGPTEGSGLIDIRAMANVTLGTREDSFGGGGSPMGDLPSFSAVPFSPVSAQLLPMRASTGMSKGVIALIAIGVVLIGGMGFAILHLLNSQSAEGPAVATGAADPFANPTAVAPRPAAPPATGTAPVTPPPTTPPPAAANPAAAAAAPGAETPPAETPPAEAAPTVAAVGKKHTGSTRKPTASKPASGKTETRTDPVVAAAPAPTRAVEPDKPKKPSNSLDDLLNGALNSGGKRPSGGDSPAPDKTPDKGDTKLGPLGKQDIVRVMSGVVPKTNSCYQKYKVPGRANVNIKVEPSGKVGSAAVTGTFAGTPSGDCVEAIIKAAKFPASDSGMAFPYPVTLH